MTLKKNLLRERNKRSGSAVGRLRGELNENLASRMLAELVKENRILSVRPATKREQAERCDFVVRHEKGTFAIQIKSSDIGASEFREAEKTRPIKRRKMKVMVFATNIALDEKKETKRLGKAIDAFIVHDMTDTS